MLQGILLPEAYNIVGTVLDLDTQKPISNGTVFVKKYDQGTSTDENGYFQLIAFRLLRSAAVRGRLPYKKAEIFRHRCWPHCFLFLLSQMISWRARPWEELDHREMLGF